MAIEAFPPVELADENGLLAVGGDLEVESLLLAYQNGIFPWPFIDSDVIPWFSPPKRGIIFVDSYEVPSSLKKILKSHSYRIEIDTATDRVIEECAKAPNRKGGRSTWITKDMMKAYKALSKAGYCHSVECFDGDELVGGLYGVSIKGMFAGESMFYKVPNASKLCLYHLLEHVKTRGGEWIDCQQLTPTVAQFGAVEVEREIFLEMLKKVLSKDARLF